MTQRIVASLSVAVALSLAGSAVAQEKVVVHKGVQAADTTDARVSIGGVKISAPWTVGASTVRDDGAIVMPANTNGPGPAYWQEMALLNSEIKIAEAEARFIDRAADEPIFDQRYYGFTTTYTPLFDRAYKFGR